MLEEQANQVGTAVAEDSTTDGGIDETIMELTGEQDDDSGPPAAGDADDPAPADSGGEDGADAPTSVDSGPGDDDPSKDVALVEMGKLFGLDNLSQFRTRSDAAIYLRGRADAVRADAESRRIAQSQQPQQASASPASVPDFKLNLPEEVDPAIAETLKGLHEYHNSRFGQLERAVVDMQRFYEDSQHARLEEQIDSAFNALAETNEGFAGLIGKGRGLELRKQSPDQYGMRDKSVSALLRAFQDFPGISPAQAAERALLFTFPDKVTEIVRQGVRKQAVARAKQVGPAPTHRKPPAKSERDDVIRHIREKQAAIGSVPGEAAEDYSDILR